MIVKIYGNKGCCSCDKAKVDNPDAEFIYINELSKEDRQAFHKKLAEYANKSMPLPICFDETDTYIPNNA